jgi:hypothetical protein
VSGQGVGGRLREHAVGERHQMGMMVGEHAAGVAPGGQRPDLDVRMADQQAQQLPAGVATGPGDRDPP